MMTEPEKVRLVGTAPALASLLKQGPVLILIAVSLMLCACVGDGGEEDEINPEDPRISDNHKVWDNLWASSPLTHDNTLRSSDYATIQGQADKCSSLIFNDYLAASGALKSSLEKSYPILDGYDYSFERVLNGLKNDMPAKGEVLIWHLYNMGYVFKTTEGAFAIDIYHRRAGELAPYIDFYGITHKHTDHKSESLASKMTSLGKPVISNFSIGGCNAMYVSENTTDYTVGPFKVHTFITNHNNSSSNVNVTVFKIDCGSGADNAVIVHSGDSNFRPEQFSTVKEAHVDVYIPRYAQTECGENEIIGKVFSPTYVLLSHILELSHTDVSSSRWPMTYGLNRAAKLDCGNSFMPFWGDKMILKNGTLK